MKLRLSTSSTQVCAYFIICFGRPPSVKKHLEHIKYPKPDSKTDPNPVKPGDKTPLARKLSAGVPGPVLEQPPPRPPSSSGTNAARGASPLQQGADPEELRRAVSPPNTRAQRPSPNDLTSQPAGMIGKPRRVPGGEDDAEGLTESAIRERALSPDQTRALSPPARGGTPTGPIIEGVAKSGQRSESPLVERERAKSPDSPNYVQQQSNLTSANGLSSAHSTKSGSTSDISADLIRDLKARDSELETLRRRQAWTKAALVQACHAGFVYVNAGPGDEDRGVTNEQPKIAEAVITLKQLHGSIQVRSHYARVVAIG